MAVNDNINLLAGLCLNSNRTNEKKNENYTTKCKLRKPTFIYNRNNEKQEIILKCSFVSPNSNSLKCPYTRYRVGRKISAPYHIMSINQAFKSMELNTDIKPNLNSYPVPNSNSFLSFNNESFKEGRRFRNATNKKRKCIVQPSKLNMVNFTHSKSKSKRTEPYKSSSKFTPELKFKNCTFKDIGRKEADKNSHRNHVSKTQSSSFLTPQASKTSSFLFKEPNRRAKKSFENSCSYEARTTELEMTPDELALYVEDYLVMPKKMSSMAEMMYL